MGLYDDNSSGYLSNAERARQEAQQSRAERRRARRQSREAAQVDSVIKSGDTVSGPISDEGRRKKTTLTTLTSDISQDESTAYGLFDVDTSKTDLGADYGYDRIRLHKNEEVSVYTAANDARYAMDPRKRNTIILAIALVLITIFALILPDSVYNTQYVNYSPALFFQQVGENLDGIARTLTGDFANWPYFKICQYIVVILAGMALATSGACYQGALKNAMASPSTLGVMSGAQMGIVIFVLFGGSTTLTGTTVDITQLQNYLSSLNIVDYLFNIYGQAFCGLLGSFVVVGLVLLLAFIAGKGKVSKVGLIIAGTVFSTLISSIIQLVRYWLINFGTEEQVETLTNMSTGTLSTAYTLESVILIGVPVIICMIIIFRMGPKMNILAFEDEEARSMGVSVARGRNLLIGLCTVITAVVVAFCGSISFVGFLVPHIARKMVGPDFRYLIPATAIAGAGFCVLSTAFTNSFLNGLGMGSITGIIGAVAFIVMAIRRRGNGNADWV